MHHLGEGTTVGDDNKCINVRRWEKRQAEVPWGVAVFLMNGCLGVASPCGVCESLGSRARPS